MHAEQKPNIEFLCVNKKTFRVCAIQGSNAAEKKQAIAQLNASTNAWRSTEENQKRIEQDILRSQPGQHASLASTTSGGSKKGQGMHANTWEGQWGGDARVMKASELAISIDTGDFSHFVSISFYRDDKFIRRLTEVKQQLSKVDAQVVASHFLADVRRIHIPLLVLRINTPERQKKAMECMQNCESTIRLLIDGIKSFNIKGAAFQGKSEKNATSVDLTIEDGKFKDFCNEAVQVLVSEFIDFGLIELTDLPPNIRQKAAGKYETNTISLPIFRAKNGSTFDATKVLASLQHFEFKSARFQTLDLSTRHSFMKANGYYLPIQSFIIAIN